MTLTTTFEKNGTIFKTCSSCKNNKPIEEFASKKHGKYGKDSICTECKNIESLNRYHKNKHDHHYKAVIANGKKRVQYKLRLEIINAYGGQCACCGETNPLFLSVDHTDNDGNIERKDKKYSKSNFYRFLKRNNYPKDKYQLLCFNCNLSKGFFGICGHKVKNFSVDDMYPLSLIGGLIDA